jgi:hypothetical protein
MANWQAADAADGAEQSHKTKTTLGERMHLGTDRFMAGKLKLGAKTRKMVFHYNSMLFEQLKAMLPITLLQASSFCGHYGFIEDCNCVVLCAQG